MKFFLSSKSKVPKQPASPILLAMAVAITAITAIGSNFQLHTFNQSHPANQAVVSVKKHIAEGNSKHVMSSSTWRNHSTKPRPAPPPTLSIPPPPATPLTFGHLGIITTFFWVGESASGDNGGIPNATSTWDGRWQEHYGGLDNPADRNGWLPSGFTPKENPFYVALPYSDINDSGNRKTNASSCPLYTAMKSQPSSWCKNSWIAIRHGSKVVYAQWEDAGPFGEDDSAYVFGSTKPANRQGAKAGLDVSPAVREYMGLQDIDNCDWTFVPAGNVPIGPWKQVITSSTGDNSVN